MAPFIKMVLDVLVGDFNGKETEVPSGYSSMDELMLNGLYRPTNIPPSYHRLNVSGVLLPVV
jgi:hypothetical protein